MLWIPSDSYLQRVPHGAIFFHVGTTSKGGSMDGEGAIGQGAAADI